MKARVGDTWYRFSSRVIGENADRYYIGLDKAYVQSVTNSGVWLHWERPYLATGGYWVTYVGPTTHAWFQYFDSNRGRFKPTREEAWKSFGIRAHHWQWHANRRAKHAAWAAEQAQGDCPHGEEAYDAPKSARLHRQLA